MTLVINTTDAAQEKALITIPEGLHIPYTQRQSLDEYSNEIEQGLEDVRNGNYVIGEQLSEDIKKW